MRLWHTAAATSAQFDDPNLVSHAGLVPVMRLAQDCGLSGLVAEQVMLAGPLGANTPLKIGCVVAGMIVGADSIDDLDLLRQAGMGRLFGGVRAPSTPARSCARSPGATCVSWRRSTDGCWPNSPTAPGSCPTRPR